MGESALWCAVIVEAIRDLGERHQVYRNAAKRWLNEDEHGVGSFEWICSNLDLDCNKIRSMSMTREGRKMLLRAKVKSGDIHETNDD